jgi:cell division protein ZapA
MSDVSIKLNIGNRTYPLTISAHEEETIRVAAKLVNEHIKALQENYAVKDMQDLLAMAALQVASKLATKSENQPSSSTPDLSELAQLLDAELNKA